MHPCGHGVTSTQLNSGARSLRGKYSQGASAARAGLCGSLGAWGSAHARGRRHGGAPQDRNISTAVLKHFKISRNKGHPVLFTVRLIPRYLAPRFHLALLGRAVLYGIRDKAAPYKYIVYHLLRGVECYKC